MWIERCTACTEGLLLRSSSQPALGNRNKERQVIPVDGLDVSDAAAGVRCALVDEAQLLKSACN